MTSTIQKTTHVARCRLPLAIGAIISAMALSVTAQADFERITIDDDATGAAFTIGANVIGLPGQKEILTANFGAFTFGPNGPVPPAAGTLTIYKSLAFGNPVNAPLDYWFPIQVFGEEAGITFPNKPSVEYIPTNRWGIDFLPDIIVPGGYFFDSFLGNARGSITWWENVGLFGLNWKRHDIVTNSQFSYHSVAYEDFDGDGIKDMMTVGEDAGNPGDPNDDIVELQFLKGLGKGKFADPVKVADGGGALITAYDINNDGLLDVVSPQFFGPVAGQPFVPPFARDASVASFVWFENNGDGTYTRWAIGTEQGPGFTIQPVDNLLGDGVTRWIATNHTNPNVAFPPFSLYPEPSVYEFTPGADPRQPWSVRTLSAAGDFPVTGGIGQAAPGAAAAGDLNGDGRLDIAVAGDGSRAVYWMEQQPDGSFFTRQLPDSDAYGQNGGPVIEDLNRSGTNEIVFSSFDQNAVSIWKVQD